LDAKFWQEFSDTVAFDGLGRVEAEFFEERSFDHGRWRKHASASRYLRDLPGLFIGTTTNRVWPVLVALLIFSSGVELYSYLAARRPSLVELELPVEPFEFTSPLLGLLLVFRTNSSYLRYVMGCRSVQKITGELSSLIRQLLTWSDGQTKRPAADVDRIIDLTVAYHCWLLNAYLVARELPEGPCEEGAAAQSALNQRLGRPAGAPLTPAQIQTLISWEINQLQHLTVFQRKDMDQCLLVGVGRELADCEQLLRSPIPVAYTRSLLRFLLVWLTLLPFALIKTFTDFNKGTFWEGQPLFIVPLTVGFIALVFLSLENIAVQIEEPFVVNKVQLQKLAEWFRQDSEDMRNVVRAMEIEMSSQHSAIHDDLHSETQQE
jgi:predicted membrane chloride channel (bestrophin family)